MDRVKPNHSDDS